MVVHPASHKIPRAPWYSGSLPLRFACLTRVSLSTPCLPRQFSSLSLVFAGPQPRISVKIRFGLFPFRSPLLRKSLRFLFLQLLRCFSSLGLTFYNQISLIRLPHSDTHDSLPACGSSCHFAAYRVLRRPPTPRHPPYALLRLTSSYF